jgi:hypothetical protein
MTRPAGNRSEEDRGAAQIGDLLTHLPRLESMPEKRARYEIDGPLAHQEEVAAAHPSQPGAQLLGIDGGAVWLLRHHRRQHFLYFFPLPHGHGSFRPTLGPFGAWLACAAWVARRLAASQLRFIDARASLRK